MKICYINFVLYILILSILSFILYNGFMNKKNYEKFNQFNVNQETGELTFLTTTEADEQTYDIEYNNNNYHIQLRIKYSKNNNVITIKSIEIINKSNNNNIIDKLLNTKFKHETGQIDDGTNNEEHLLLNYTEKNSSNVLFDNLDTHQTHADKFKITSGEERISLILEINPDTIYDINKLNIEINYSENFTQYEKFVDTTVTTGTPIDDAYNQVSGNGFCEETTKTNKIKETTETDLSHCKIRCFDNEHCDKLSFNETTNECRQYEGLCNNLDNNVNVSSFAKKPLHLNEDYIEPFSVNSFYFKVSNNECNNNPIVDIHGSSAIYNDKTYNQCTENCDAKSNCRYFSFKLQNRAQNKGECKLYDSSCSVQPLDNDGDVDLYKKCDDATSCAQIQQNMWNNINNNNCDKTHSYTPEQKQIAMSNSQNTEACYMNLNNTDNTPTDTGIYGNISKSIRNYTYIGKGYCQPGYLDRIAPGQASTYHSDGIDGNKSLEECTQLCNQKSDCKYMSYVDNSDNTRNNICSLYDSNAGDCENNNRVSEDSHLTYKKNSAIENYTHVGNGHCDETGNTEIDLINGQCLRDVSSNTLEKCAEKCNNNNECDNISFLSTPNEHYCCLYDTNNSGLCTSPTDRGYIPMVGRTDMWGEFQTYKKKQNCSDYTKAFETVKDNNAGDTTYTNTTCGEKLNWYNNNTDMTDEQKKIQIMYKDTNSPGCIPIGCKSFNERN